MNHSRHKYFFSPANTGYYKIGNPTPENIEFYRLRSSKELHCSIVGNVATTRGFLSNNNTGRVSADSSWKRLANAISTNGSKPGIQISSCWNNYIGQREFINCNWGEYTKVVRSILKHVDLDEIFDDFNRSAEISIKNGFKHIQIHAAHGYLLSSLTDPHLYDDVHSVIDRLGALATNLRRDAEISIRVSTYCGLSKNVETDRAKALSRIFELSFDFFDLSEGYYNLNKNIIYPSTEIEQRQRLDRSIAIAREFPEKMFIVSGHGDCIKDVPLNVCIGFCRNIIADPKFIERRLNGCCYCGECHYHSRGESKLSCSQWGMHKPPNKAIEAIVKTPVD
jgi:NADPH2 dehydrogenase